MHHVFLEYTEFFVRAPNFLRRLEMDADVIVIGSGPGGATAAYVASKQGHRVLLLERGSQPEYSVENHAGATFGQTLNRLKYLKDRVATVLGGGAHVNYGVVASPSNDDIRRALGPAFVSRLQPFVRDVLGKVAEQSRPSPLVGRMSKRLVDAWNLKRKRDPASSSQLPPHETHDNTLLHTSTLEIGEDGYRSDFVSLLDRSDGDVVIRTEAEVVRLEPLPDDAGWVVHTTKRFYVAPHVIVAGGALESARLLLASALPRGISTHVGKHLKDHRRLDVIFRASQCDQFRRSSRISFVASRRLCNTDDPASRVHIEMVEFERFDALATALSTRLPCVTSKALEWIPSWAEFNNTLGDENTCSCTVYTLFTCNPLQCVRNRVLFVIGKETDVDGEVKLDAKGRRVLIEPSLDAAGRETLQTVASDVDRIIKDQANGERFDHVRDDTEWHYVGTARMDDAVTEDFVLRDADGLAYASGSSSLRIGDASALRHPSVFNTQTMASFVGYCAAIALGSRPTHPHVMMRD